MDLNRHISNLQDGLLRIARKKDGCRVLGPGSRAVVWFHGCSRGCLGCIAEEMNRSESYELIKPKELSEWVLSCQNIDGVTLTGGEPFEQVPALLDLAKNIKGAGLTLMSYSGYTLEELEGRHDKATDELLEMLDILVDGRYDEKLRNLTLVYCGSENQRVIDMKKTRRARREGDAGMVIPYKSGFDFEIKI